MVRGDSMVEHVARESPTRVLAAQHPAGVAEEGRELFVHAVHDPRDQLSVLGSWTSVDESRGINSVDT